MIAPSINKRTLVLLFVVLAAVHTWPLLPQAATHTLDDGDVTPASPMQKQRPHQLGPAQIRVEVPPHPPEAARKCFAQPQVQFAPGA